MGDAGRTASGRLTLLAYAQEYMTDPYKREAESIAAALDALQRLVEANPVEESVLDLIYRCRYCGVNGGHEEDCPWRLGRAALDRLNRG